MAAAPTATRSKISHQGRGASDERPTRNPTCITGRVWFTRTDTWNCKRAQVSLKATIDVPMFSTIIEQNGDGLLEDSHMPVFFPSNVVWLPPGRSTCFQACCTGDQLINSRRGRSCSGRKSKLVEDRYIDPHMPVGWPLLPICDPPRT